MDANIPSLKKEQIEELYEAILDAFPLKGNLSQVVYLKLGENLDNLAEGNMQEIVLDLVKWLVSTGKVELFVRGALEKNPDNPRLKSIGSEILDHLSQPIKESTRGGDQLSDKSLTQRVTNTVVNITGPERSSIRQFENDERVAGTSKVYSDGNLDISNKRGQRTQDAKSSDNTFNISVSTYKQLAKSQMEAKNLKNTVEEQKSRIDRLNQFLLNAKAAISEVNALIKQYEEVNQKIEPHLISYTLLVEYTNLCNACSFANKRPTKENLGVMRQQAMKINRDCQRDSFPEWVSGLKFPDESQLVETHIKLCGEVKVCVQALETQLTPSCDLNLLISALNDLSSTVSNLLDSWTKAQNRLHDEITSRLTKIREELT